MMMKKLARTGNSHAIILDRAILGLVGANANTLFWITVKDGAIVLRPVVKPKKPRGG